VDDLTEDEKKAAEGKNWKTDLSGGIQRVVIKHGCARTATPRPAAWRGTSPTPVPIHREPLYTSGTSWSRNTRLRGSQAFFRLPTRYKSIQATDYSKQFPLIWTSGRLVEYEGGGDETVQSVARRAAAGHVHRDQPEGCQRRRRAGRPHGVGREPKAGRSR